MPDLDDLTALDRLGASEAVTLFAERAAAAEADFTLTLENAPAVAAICQQLDGLPLAIELAAARVPAFSPMVLHNRLERWLPLLTGGPRDAPQRLQTMRDAIAWSVDLLPHHEQQLFQRLAVFVDGFTLDAAQAVASDAAVDNTAAVDGITSLIHKSLLRQRMVNGIARFWMLETIREYGLELLAKSGDEAAVRREHAAWCLALSERAGPELSGPDQEIWVERLETELGNIRAALAWLREQEETESALRLAGPIGWFWMMPGRFHEGGELFAALIAMPGAEDRPESLARALVTAAELENWLGDYARARDLSEQALTLYRELDDRRNVASVLRGLGSIAIDQGDPVAAIRLLDESLLHARAMGEQWEVAGVTNLLGVAAFAIGDSEVAITRHEEALTEWRQLGDTTHTSTALTSLGLVAFASGQFERAAAVYRESLELAASVDDRFHVVRAVEGFGLLSAAWNDSARAARLLGAAETQFERFGTPRRQAAQAVVDGVLSNLRSALGEAEFATAWEAGRALSLDDAASDARATPGPSSRALPQHSLSRREVEVLQLVARGLTNAEIAGELFVSPRTVEQHLRNIYAKLEIRSRAVATRFAIEHGIG